jgi:hypothetical protein
MKYTVTGLVHMSSWHNGANAVFNAMKTLPDLTRIYLYQSFIKTAINTAITVKLLTSKVKLLNTCEKLKIDLGNIKSKVNETCCCEDVTNHN